MNWYYVLVPALVVIGLLVSIFLRKQHVRRRQEERRCKACGDITKRRYQMVEDTSQPTSRWGKAYRRFILDDCGCGVVHTPDKGVVKFFNLVKLGWRHVTDPSQFVIDEDLLHRAGLVETSVESLFERVQKMEQQMEERARRLASSVSVTGNSTSAEMDKPTHAPFRKHVPPVSLPSDLLLARKSH